MTGPDAENYARHWQQKLTDHDVELIRALRDEGLSLQEIADKFEVTKQHVSRIVAFSARISSRRSAMQTRIQLRVARQRARGHQSTPKSG